MIMFVNSYLVYILLVSTLLFYQCNAKISLIRGYTG